MANPVLDTILRHEKKAVGLVIMLALYSWLNPTNVDFRSRLQAETRWYNAGEARMRTASVRYAAVSYSWDGAVLTVSSPAWDHPDGWSVDGVWARGRLNGTFGKNLYATRTVDDEDVEHLALNPASLPANATSGDAIEIKVTYRLVSDGGLYAHSVMVPYEDATKP